MKKNQKDEITKLFIKQYNIINQINENIECDLYVCFDREEEKIKNLIKKQDNLINIKNQLIKLYGKIISEL